MFRTLTLILVWLLIGTIAYSLFQRFYPKGTFLGRVVLGVLFVILLLAFVNPNDPAVLSLWRLISFPLKPLGASVLLLIFAAQRIKGGGIDGPGGYLLGWALAILMLSSTPAIAYFLVRSPVAMISEPQLVTQQVVPNFQLASAVEQAAPTPGTLVALSTANPVNSISDIAGDKILPSTSLNQVTLSFNSLKVTVPPYLLQNPQEIRTRGLRPEDFVPNAETLQLTTQVWDSYLSQIYGFLRGR
ncbi:hypothetical protein [Fortiea contorta]|uniref:hypothetical protein n=1 Tax=Fortiea contorta TaxID=1892405 RepID=UPI0003675133|nr:hypothetical protein [Fortiea contorta]